MPATCARRQVEESLHGARVAFTGRLASMSRRAAHELVRAAGAAPTTAVSGRTTHLVIGMHGWPLRTDGSVTAKLQRAEQLRGRNSRLRIISEIRFLELTGLREPAPAVRKSYPLEQVAELVGEDTRTIQRWEYLGLVRSVDGAYDFQDVVSLQAIAALVRSGVQPQQIRRSLSALATFLPGTDRPLAQLSIVASRRGELLAQVGNSLLAPDGQHLFDFDGTVEPAADAGTSRKLEPADDVDALFERAVWLDETERYEEAADAYRAVIARDPSRSEAYFNLGNVLRMSGRVEAAEELYLIAVAIDPTNAAAWYNLADVQEEEDRDDEAIESLSRAVEADPQFADAYFNLASCLEHAGRPTEAAERWRTYLKLDPASDWADVARRHLARHERGSAPT